MVNATMVAGGARREQGETGHARQPDGSGRDGDGDAGLACTTFEPDLSPCQDGAYSFQNDEDAPGQGLYFQNAGVGTAPEPLGRPARFQSSAGGLPSGKLLTVGWRGVSSGSRSCCAPTASTRSPAWSRAPALSTCCPAARRSTSARRSRAPANGVALETLQSPAVAFQPSYPVQGAQRFLLAVGGSGGIENGGYGIGIPDVEPPPPRSPHRRGPGR